MGRSKNYYTVMAIIFALAILFAAKASLPAKGLDIADVYFGWALNDTMIFMELPNVYEDDDFLARFSLMVEPIPFRHLPTTVMCDYRRLDSLPGISAVISTGVKVSALIEGTLQSGSVCGFAYVRDQVTGYLLPGELISMKIAGQVRPCTGDCEFYCSPVLIIDNSVSESKFDSVIGLVEIQDFSSLPREVLRFGSELEMPAVNQIYEECRTRYFVFKDNKYFLNNSCLSTGTNLGSKYFMVTPNADGTAIFEELLMEDSTNTPSLEFLATFNFNGEKYILAKAVGYESVAMSVYRWDDIRLRLAAQSFIFGE